MTIVDLGCAPGSFLQVAQQHARGSRIVGIDLLDIEPMEGVEFLKGDCSKAKKELSWKHKYTFETMLDEMIEHWLNYYNKENK